ncbi:MAG: class I SAM-dependent methyltransferase [Candidatus Poribacteria bacterium]|nr:class I SAM-dependent methyltransferase [Candidatus Poribacteria bacterium]
MSEQKSDATYTMGRTQEETERLIQQSGLYEDVTKRLLEEAGLFNGMKVLDIGSGAGDVAMAAAELVGADGEVIGVDVNAEILETARARAQGAGLENIQFLAGDARTLDLPNDFDALIGRLVLMYMADPADALRQLKPRLRPGAIIAFQEVDFTSISAYYLDHTPLMNNLATWAVEVFKRSGAHTGMGFDLYGAFLDAGLPEPALRYTAPMGAAEAWGGYQFVANSFRSILPLMESYGIVTAEEVDIETLPQRIRDEVVSSKRPILLPPHVTAWTQIPS